MFATPVPVYVRRSPEKAAEDLAAVLGKLKLEEVAPIQEVAQEESISLSETPSSVCHPDGTKFRLNAAHEEEVSETLLTIHGIGPRSVNKILGERLVNGDFLGRDDFDRRVKGITFARLETLCAQSNIIISLSPSLAPTRRCGRPRHPRYGSSNSLLRGLRQRQPRHDSSNIPLAVLSSQEKSLVLATWNTGCMSKRGAFYEAKIGHLLRFVDDSGPDVLMLQEVCRGVGRDMSRRLSAEFGVSWTLHEDEASDRSLVMLYRGDRAVVSSALSDEAPNIFAITKDFQRQPQLAFVQAGEFQNELLAILHVHLYQADPREEISRIADLITLLRRFLGRSGRRGSVMLVGDFNLNADSKAFDRIRRRGMVELVCPERRVAPPHPYRMLHAETTVGGQWYDNFWVAETKRPCVREAWCFDFGGRRRNLKQSGYEFAADKRSTSSDHLPLVLRIGLGLEVASQPRRVLQPISKNKLSPKPQQVPDDDEHVR